MHFKTLVTVNMPTVEEDPHENAAVEQSIELLQARKDDLAKDIMAEFTLCSLMGRTTNFARQLVGAVEEVMTPYSTEPDGHRGASLCVYNFILAVRQQSTQRMCKFILWVLFYIDRSRKVPPNLFF